MIIALQCVLYTQRTNTQFEQHFQFKMRVFQIFSQNDKILNYLNCVGDLNNTYPQILHHELRSVRLKGISTLSSLNP